MGEFAGKVVLITGAASGFGAAAARRFAELGAHLALSDLDVPDGPSGALTAAVDVTDPAAHEAHVATVLERWGKLDIAINNAGIPGELAPLHKIPVDQFDQVIAVNLRGVFLGMRAQLPPMIAAGGGAILNVASAAGLVGAGQMAAYAASKHGVVGLTRAAADEVARHGIRVNALCPSFASTPLLDGLTEGLAERRGITRAETEHQITGRIPMGRIATQDEVVQAMVWAVSPANSFMTGQALAIDGGLTAV